MCGLQPHHKFLEYGVSRFKRYIMPKRFYNVPFETLHFKIKLQKNTIKIVINKVAEYNCFEV